MSSLASLSFDLLITIASITILKLFFFNFSDSGIRTDCLLPEKARAALRFLREQKNALSEADKLPKHTQNRKSQP